MQIRFKTYTRAQSGLRQQHHATTTAEQPPLPPPPPPRTSTTTTTTKYHVGLVKSLRVFGCCCCGNYNQATSTLHSMYCLFQTSKIAKTVLWWNFRVLQVPLRKKIRSSAGAALKKRELFDIDLRVRTLTMHALRFFQYHEPQFTTPCV